MKTHVKICGITRVSDARAADEAGADYIGIILDIKESPRSVSLKKAEEIITSSKLPAVILLENTLKNTIDKAAVLRPYAIQLIGDYTPLDVEYLKNQLTCRIWKTISIPQTGTDDDTFTALVSLISNFKNAGTDAIILDTLVENKKGGTGKTCDWDTAEKLKNASDLPLFLAGGINPENAGEAVKKVRPYGIDLSSGVEKRPGEKEPGKIQILVKNVRNIK